MVRLSYDVKLPDARTSSVIFASPHSGRVYPPEFLRQSVLNEHTIRSSEDAFVDILFEEAPLAGVPFLTATAPRAYVDLNRSRNELDPALIMDVRKGGHNPRVASGLGVIPRVVANGQQIYRGKMSLIEAEARLDQIWLPYHQALLALLAQSHAMFGEAILIDCHSMPHEALESIGNDARPRADIVLGDRFGASADRSVVEQVEKAFVDAGLNVARNAPFAGAYVTQHYGRPSHEQHAVQIEIDRSIYMDELKIEPNANFDAFKSLITDIVFDVAAIGASDLTLAAE